MTITEKYKGKIIKKVSNTGISKEEYNTLTNQIEELNNGKELIVAAINDSSITKDSTFEDISNAIINGKGAKIVSGDTYRAYSAGTYASYAQITKTNMQFGNFVCGNSGTYLCSVTMSINSGSYNEQASCGYTIYNSNGSVFKNVTLASATLSSSTRTLSYSSSSYSPLNISIEAGQSVKAWMKISTISSGNATYSFSGFVFDFDLE